MIDQLEPHKTGKEYPKNIEVLGRQKGKMSTAVCAIPSTKPGTQMVC